MKTVQEPLFSIEEVWGTLEYEPAIAVRNDGFPIISLFAGAGGMDIGFEKAGFHTVWANEYDKSILPSFGKYFKETALDGRSISDIPDAEIPQAEGIIGGPPCQSWSEAGAKRGITDSRGKLFHEYIRVLKHVRPKFFVAENVHGLVHERNQEAFKQILEMFRETGYSVSWKLLKASDYGVPQDRERVFIVGIREDLGRVFEFPAPIEQRTTLKDAISDLRSVPLGKSSIVAGSIKNHEITDTGFSPIFMSRNRVRSWDEPSYTILACDRHTPLHPQAPKMPLSADKKVREFAAGFEDKYRRLSVRECARIQTFPDEYEFIYTHPRTGYKMVGNAVPPLLAYHVAVQIKTLLSLK